MNAVENEDYVLPIRYREGCKRIDIFSLDLSNCSSARYFKLSIKLSLISEQYNIELIKNSLVILQRRKDDLSRDDQQRLFKLLIDYLNEQQEHFPYFYVNYTSLATLLSGWMVLAAFPNLSVILGSSLLCVFTFVGIETILALSLGALVGYLLYRGMRYLIQSEVEKKLLDAFIVYKDYLDAIDSFIQPSITQENNPVTQFFPIQNRRRIYSAENVEQINFIKPIISVNPA